MSVPGETARCPEDVALARLALAGDTVAIRVIDQHFADVRAALKGVVPDHEIDELVQETRVKILVGDKPALASFTGRGPLRAWLRVALLRAGLDRRRKTTGVHLDDAAWLALPVDGDDPTLAAMRGSLGPVVRRALEAAIANLDARERLILRQHLVDGLPAPDLAVLHGVHRVTAFRWLVTIRKRVLDHVRASVSSELAIGGESLASLMRQMRASVVPTVERLLVADEPR